MKNVKSTGILATLLLATSGIAIAAERNTPSVAPVDSSQETAPATSNKLGDQDLSDKAIRESQSGADTKIIRMGFKRLDSNDDGSITSDEASMQPPLNTQFKTVDKNSDNKIDMQEFARFAEANGESIQNDQEKTPKGNTSPGASKP